MTDTTGYRVRRDKVRQGGTVTLHCPAKLHHIGVGRANVGWRVILFVVGREVRILGVDGPLLRQLILNPSRDYQPLA